MNDDKFDDKFVVVGILFLVCCFIALFFWRMALNKDKDVELEEQKLFDVLAANESYQMQRLSDNGFFRIYLSNGRVVFMSCINSSLRFNDTSIFCEVKNA